VLVQDQASSVVWGMPGAVATAGFADEVLPLDRVAEAIHRHLAAASAPATAGSIR
jgi:two-component system chemotaxis response regulator CheB